MTEIDQEALESLVGFAETHGDEYGSVRTYLALMQARDALGYDDIHPYTVWRSEWGEKPDHWEVTPEECDHGPVVNMSKADLRGWDELDCSKCGATIEINFDSYSGDPYFQRKGESSDNTK